VRPAITIRPFEAADAEALRQAIDTGANLLDWAAGAASGAGPAGTGLVDGKVAGCGGVVLLWPGVGEAWSVWAPWAANYRKYMLLYCRQFIGQTMDRHKLHRIQATLRADLPESWLRHLGFVPEGRMRKYGPDGCDSTKWAIIRE
jgi:hypothetical protein